MIVNDYDDCFGVELYFKDLKEDTQKELLKTLNMSDPKDANWDVFPITELCFQKEAYDE